MTLLSHFSSRRTTGLESRDLALQHNFRCLGVANRIRWPGGPSRLYHYMYYSYSFSLSQRRSRARRAESLQCFLFYFILIRVKNPYEFLISGNWGRNKQAFCFSFLLLRRIMMSKLILSYSSHLSYLGVYLNYIHTALPLPPHVG